MKQLTREEVEDLTKLYHVGDRVYGRKGDETLVQRLLINEYFLLTNGETLHRSEMKTVRPT